MPNNMVDAYMAIARSRVMVDAHLCMSNAAFWIAISIWLATSGSTARIDPSAIPSLIQNLQRRYLVSLSMSQQSP